MSPDSLWFPKEDPPKEGFSPEPDPGGLRPKEESLVLVQAEGGSPNVVAFCSQAVWLVGLEARTGGS